MAVALEWIWERDACGYIGAIKQRRPELLKRLDVQQAIAQIENAQRALDSIVTEVIEAEEAEE